MTHVHVHLERGHGASDAASANRAVFASRGLTR
ncbi:hypothetical protein AWB78_00749 [Caballeronia calidae]|uniref:Uncharacterized protein n=1 Tax=Caballeronia calidae TaxID=1777139 RepID=A0A157ZMN5_9BURK|nr:hypothetical protein AWB78_00749 [Caballeronia calidae]